jgi:tetratricopeptide (TPR) repeat protein
MGFLHMWIGQSMRANEFLGADKAPILDPVTKVLQEWGGSAGLMVKDSQTAFDASEKLLETAGMKEPNYLWAHIWLGKIQSYYSLNAAEMTYSKCLELRPGFEFVYGERAWIRLAWARQVKPEGDAAKIRAALEYRCQEDIESALQRSPHKPYYHYLQGEFYRFKEKLPQALKEWTHAVELERPLRTLDGRVGDQQIRFGHAMKKLLADFPESTERGILYALACWALDEDKEALEAATKVLLESPQNPRALVVRGAVALKQNQAQEARADFESALKQQPRLYLARAGRARALALLNRQVEALAAYTALREMADTDWQKVEMHLGRARALTALGRAEEARAAQAAADAIMPGSAL